MRLLGFNISRITAEKALSSVDDGGRGWYKVFERFPGAFQQNVEVKFDSVLSNHADFACRTLIASDIAKLRIKLVQKNESGIWTEVSNPAYSPVLRKPNHFQNRMQFVESWVLSKLQSGNTYVLKQRDNRGVVVKLYVLDPRMVTPLVSDTGDVFYQLNSDHLAGLQESVVVPSREIIHDRFNCFYHPLVGLSPIFAGGLAAMQGLAIQNDSASFFKNGARPGGVLTAPGAIEDETAKRIKDYWDTNFAGDNSGKVAVLGDNLKYEPMKAKSTDSQLIEQLQWSAQVICSTYHVPPYKVGIGQMPAFNNIQALNVEYYSQCLQTLIEAMEICLDEGLGMGEGIGTELDTDNLLRMDALTQMDVLDKGKNIFTPDEARARINLAPTPGGSVVYRQQQDFSLEALSKRDAQADPFGTAPKPEPTPTPTPATEPEKAVSVTHTKGLFAGARTTRKAA
ncbi:HK97 family phage portal protein [Rhizobium mesoamericanum]|uniref:phage portal protein n=1 Tax=Rhizobium mesoamericanum TaxID=1079800 RepID=UPI00278A218C|nr:phage portal protein [Rhizobium mesoamericanum]MDQ0558316.1 HK97 family phage portal protein [Rhizobium mesoamericanum]